MSARSRDRPLELQARLCEKPALQQRGVTSVRDLERLLDPAEPRDVVLDAAELLGLVGDATSLAPLRRLLQSSTDPEVRQVAGLSIGLIGGPEAVRSLSDALEHEADPFARGGLLDALAYPGLREASDVLRRVLNDADESPSVRGVAAESLGRIAAGDALDDLLSALTDREPEIRFFAAHALGMLGSRDAIEALTRVARDDTAAVPGLGTVAEEAREAIVAITDDGKG